MLQPADQLNPGTNAPGYMKQLDALRAFAVLAVLWSHYVPRKYSFLGINLGEFGVRLFFGLSGFLITGILLASRQRVLSGSENIASALRQFYIRRSLRIFPVFYATLAAMFLLKIPPVRETFAWHVFYLSNFYMAKVGSYPGSVSHLWSLAIEEQFYLFWPWVILWLPRKYLFSAILSLIVAGPLFRVVGVLVNLNDVANRVLTPAAFDSLGCGCLLAYLNGGQRNLTPASRKFINACISVGLPMLFIALVLGYFAYDRMMDTMLTNTAAALTFTWLVARAAEGFRGVTGTVLELRPIVYLGKNQLRNLYFSSFRTLCRFQSVPESGIGFRLPQLAAGCESSVLDWHHDRFSRAFLAVV